MKKIFLAAGLASLATVASAANYTVDPFHTNARFAIDHFATSSNVGGFYGLTGNLQLDVAKKTGQIDISIPVQNLQTGSTQFTQHLLSPDLFNAAQYPEMRFKSTKFNFRGKKLVSVDGQLTLLGKTNPVRLKVEKFNCYDSPMLKKQVCGGDLSTTIDRTQWGMNYLVNVGMAKNVRLDIQVEASKD